jgi:hypothetical protein
LAGCAAACAFMQLLVLDLRLKASNQAKRASCAIQEVFIILLNDGHTHQRRSTAAGCQTLHVPWPLPAALAAGRPGNAPLSPPPFSPPGRQQMRAHTHTHCRLSASYRDDGCSERVDDAPQRLQPACIVYTFRELCLGLSFSPSRTHSHTLSFLPALSVRGMDHRDASTSESRREYERETGTREREREKEREREREGEMRERD